MEFIEVILVNKNAKLPKKATAGSSGFDLYSCESCIINAGERRLIQTGIRFNIPKGYEVQIRSRSGLALKQGLHVLNSPGTIDSDYNQPSHLIGVILHNSSNYPFAVDIGDRIAQAVVQKVPEFEMVEVEMFSAESERGGGFGSTGK